MPYSSNEEFLETLKSLIDVWCDKRSILSLSRVLGPFLSFNGLKDGWAELAIGLKTVRAQDRDKLAPEEMAIVEDLIRAADEAIYGSQAAPVGGRRPLK